MKFGIFAAALVAAMGVTGVTLNAASDNTVKIQVFDQRGAPVRDAVIELVPAQGTAGTIRFPWHMAMAQKDQQFVPDTLIVAKGSTVAFPNLDRVRHSVYSFSKAARFEIDLYGRDQTRRQNFPIAGTVALGCNIHDNMTGHIRVVETPHAAKTDANGVVRLTGTPMGKGTVTVWHPQLRGKDNEFSGAITIDSANDAKTVRIALR